MEDDLNISKGEYLSSHCMYYEILSVALLSPACNVMGWDCHWTESKVNLKGMEFHCSQPKSKESQLVCTLCLFSPRLVAHFCLTSCSSEVLVCQQSAPVLIHGMSSSESATTRRKQIMRLPFTTLYNLLYYMLGLGQTCEWLNLWVMWKYPYSFQGEPINIIFMNHVDQSEGWKSDKREPYVLHEVAVKTWTGTWR